MGMAGDQGIRGGFEVSEPLPWFVSWDHPGLQAGALVNPDIVLTTASALSLGLPNYVRIGSTKRDEGGTLMEVVGAVIHPDYVEGVGTGPANIAVLKLKESLINSLALVNEESLVPKSNQEVMFLAGFGQTNTPPPDFPSTLQGMFTNYTEDCFAVIPGIYNPINHICATASPAGGCLGDGGGPLVMEGTRNVVGLLFGADGPCNGTATTNFYTRVSSFAPWVKATICDISKSQPSYCDKDSKEDDDGCFLGCFLHDLFSFFANLF